MIKTDIPGLIRDEVSNAIINTNNGALSEYKAKKKQIQEMKEMKQRMDSIEGKLDTLLSLLERNN